MQQINRAHLLLWALMLLLAAAGSQLAAGSQRRAPREVLNDDFSDEAILSEEGGYQAGKQHHHHSGGQAGAGGGIFESISGGLADIVNGRHKGAPAAGAGSGGGAVVTGLKQVFGAPAEKKEEKDLFGLKGLGELAKLLLNPFELVKAISAHFKLPLDKFTEAVGKGLIFGSEALLHPLVVSVKIVEKVFVPDSCRLRFLCRLGSQLRIFREAALRFSPSFLELSAHVSAFSDGIVGKDCDIAFPECEPKLRKPFEGLAGKKAESLLAGGEEAVAASLRLAKKAPLGGSGAYQKQN